MFNLEASEVRELLSLPENYEKMSLAELREYEKSLGNIRMKIRNVQVILKKRTQELNDKEPVTPLFLKGVPSTKAVGTPGG